MRGGEFLDHVFKDVLHVVHLLIHLAQPQIHAAQPFINILLRLGEAVVDHGCEVIEGGWLWVVFLGHMCPPYATPGLQSRCGSAPLKRFKPLEYLLDPLLLLQQHRHDNRLKRPRS